MEDALNSYLIQLLSCTPSIYRNDTEDRVNKAKDITFDILSITRKSQDGIIYNACELSNFYKSHLTFL